MKDPLDTRETAYDILALERHATNEDVKAAFAGRIRVVEVNAATQAFRTLGDRTRRAEIDAFYYHPDILTRLEPNPIVDPSALLQADRAATASSWERAMIRSFPNTAITHALAVLWYWWARETTPGDSEAAAAATSRGTRSDLPVSYERWRRAIAYWVAVLNATDFWKSLGYGDVDAADLNARIISQLRDEVRSAATQLGKNGRELSLEVIFATELRTAADLSAAKLKTPKGPVRCGRLMLEYAGLLDAVRQQLQDGAARGLGRHAAVLEESLSDFASIAVLVRENQPEAALAAIAELSQKQQTSAEVKRLASKAHLSLGKQQAALGDYDAALESWAAALKLSRRDAVAKDDIANTLVAAIEARAAQLQTRQPDEAVGLLEKALVIVSNERLALTLAEILTTRGIDRLNRAHRQLEESDGAITPDEIVSTMESGVDDLERGASLGSTRAAEQLDAARAIQTTAKSGYYALPPICRQKRERSFERGAAGDWTGAVDLLREALGSAGGSRKRTDPGETPGSAVIERDLANALANRGVIRSNSAIAMIDAMVSEHNALIASFDAKLDQYDAQVAKLDPLYAAMRNAPQFGQTSLLRCFNCGRSQPGFTAGGSYYGSPGDTEQWYTLQTKRGRTAGLCGRCHSEYQRLLRAVPKPSPEAVTLMQEAWDDLTEATVLDPESSYARDNLQVIEGIVGQLRQAGMALKQPKVSSKRLARGVPRAKAKIDASDEQQRGLLDKVFLWWRR